MPDFCQTMSSLERVLKAYEQAGRILPSQYQCRSAAHSFREEGAEGNSISDHASSWWSQTESNRRHPACKAGALPTELWPHSSRNGANPGELSATCRSLRGWPARLVGPGRLELPTLRLSGVRSNQAELRAYGSATAGRFPFLGPGSRSHTPSRGAECLTL